MNRHFSDNPALEAPGYGGMVGMSVRPNDKFYVTAGSADAYGDLPRSTSARLARELSLPSAKLASRPSSPGMRTADTRSGPWYISARPKFGLPSDEGVTAVVDQELSDGFQFFVRYGYDARSLSAVHNFGKADTEACSRTTRATCPASHSPSDLPA